MHGLDVGIYQGPISTYQLDLDKCFTGDCAVWTIFGDYHTGTDYDGQSFLRLKMKLVAPFAINKTRLLAGWFMDSGVV